MKKTLRFLQSMQFGLVLMGLVLVCSLLGSLIAQGEDAAFYVSAFPRAHPAILALGLDDVFNGWFFIALLALFCVNLTLCSILRIRRVVASDRGAVALAGRVQPRTALDPADADRLCTYLRARGFRQTEAAGGTVYHKNRLGWYGSFITHASILLTLVMGTAALYLPVTVDRSCLPGEALTLPDGVTVAVRDFRIEDETGRLDYASTIRVTLRDGRDSGDVRIGVNHPFAFGNYKFYQQTYGTAGAITVRNAANGATERFMLTEASLLSADGTNGLWYMALYPGYTRDEAGNFTLIASTSGAYRDPVYQVMLTSGGDNTPILAFPGETLTLGELSFTMEPPVAFPGLRIKRTPPLVYPLLYGAFLLMLLGLWLCFFHVPAYVTVGGDAYAVSGPKPEDVRLELMMLLEDKTAEQRKENEGAQ